MKTKYFRPSTTVYHCDVQNLIAASPKTNIDNTENIENGGSTDDTNNNGVVGNVKEHNKFFESEYDYD
jgi:hypothetical protein